MFRRCMELPPEGHQINIKVQSKPYPTDDEANKDSSIRIGGGSRRRKLSPNEMPSPTQSRHAHGINVLSKSQNRKEVRSVSVDIKGPIMDLDRIRRGILDQSSRMSITDQSINHASGGKTQRNVNSLKRVVKPAVCSPYVPKRDVNILQNLETRESQESAIRIEGRPPSIHIISEKSPTPQSPYQEQQWQRPYLPQPLNVSRRKARGNKVLNTIESINCSEDSNNKSSSMVNSEECMRDLFRPHLTLTESLVGQNISARNPQTSIRMSESIIENTPRNHGIGGNSAFRIFWSHSVEVPGQQYTAMDKLTRFLLNIKYLGSQDEQIANRQSSICKRLSYHPNILSHYHTFTNGNHFFVAQQYFEGTLESLFGRMTINKVRGLAVGIIEAIESVHNDNIAHTQINARNIVVVRGVFKLTNFGHAVFNPSRELRFEDYNSFGRTLAVLAESMMLDSLLLKKQDAGDFMNLVYLLQQEECSIAEVRKHPFFNRPSLI